MFHIGVDLAWGMRRPTGLAVLDDDGRLVHVSAVRTDEEILAALAPYVEGECLVAIDAPLIVTNPTGNRPAEAALNKDFARFDAGAHPSNTGKPEFRDTPRGAGLCQALGLDMNPRSGRRRRAIEVYPHPATVALFRLGRTLKYKNKPGRDLDGLRVELLTLMGLLEALAIAEPTLHVTADPCRRRFGHRQGRPRLGGLAAAGRDRDPQERAAGRRGPGRRGGVRLRRAVRRPPARRHHDVRRLRDRLHRHPDPARRPLAQPPDAGADRATGCRVRPGAGVHR